MNSKIADIKVLCLEHLHCLQKLDTSIRACLNILGPSPAKGLESFGKARMPKQTCGKASAEQ